MAQEEEKDIQLSVTPNSCTLSSFKTEGLIHSEYPLHFLYQINCPLQNQ